MTAFRFVHLPFFARHTRRGDRSRRSFASGGYTLRPRRWGCRGMPWNRYYNPADAALRTPSFSNSRQGCSRSFLGRLRISVRRDSRECLRIGQRIRSACSPCQAPTRSTRSRMLTPDSNRCRVKDDVRFGSLADILTSPRHVRYSPQSRHSLARVARPLVPLTEQARPRSAYRVL